MKMNKHLGLGPNHDFMYLQLNNEQDFLYELNNIRKVLGSFVLAYCKEKDLDITKDINVEFINYGHTELVYVMTVKNQDMYTILVKQPKVEQGQLKEEYDNLHRLRKLDNMIVVPTKYMSFDDDYCKGEAFMTPYMYQARCIGSDVNWGIYVPEPFYRFENFNDEQRFFVNMAMIAKLVYLYDDVNKQGIGSCKLGGGDFILPKGWEEEEPCQWYTLSSMYLTAARKMIDCSLEQYLDILRDEFSRATIQEDQSTLLVNHRGRVAMSVEEIEEGIDLGLKLRRSREATYPNVKR